MFLAKYELDNKEYNYIYYNNRNGWEEYHKDTFSPYTKNMDLLILKVSGKNYEERKQCLYDLAIDYSYNFASLSWSYGELAEICNFFETNGKRYGLLKEFKENAIC